MSAKRAARQIPSQPASQPARFRLPRGCQRGAADVRGQSNPLLCMRKRARRLDWVPRRIRDVSKVLFKCHLPLTRLACCNYAGHCYWLESAAPSPFPFSFPSHINLLLRNAMALELELVRSSLAALSGAWRTDCYVDGGTEERWPIERQHSESLEKNKVFFFLCVRC